MDWLKSLFPMLGAAIGGPFGSVASSFIADKLGVDRKTVNDVLGSGKITSEHVEAIRAAEVDFRKFCEANEITRETLSNANTQGARDMQVATRSLTPAVLTYLITVGFFGIMAFMMSDAYVSSEPLLVMLGSLGTAWIACCNFWFGSTNSGQRKTELISRAGPVG
jgi:hypothetical protein